jgi:hypothetical protein
VVRARSVGMMRRTFAPRCDLTFDLRRGGAGSSRAACSNWPWPLIACKCWTIRNASGALPNEFRSARGRVSPDASAGKIPWRRVHVAALQTRAGTALRPREPRRWAS